MMRTDRILINDKSWRKSSRSNGGNGNCVEVAHGVGGFGVRDTKNRSAGTLLFGPNAWSAFTAGVKAGRFRR